MVRKSKYTLELLGPIVADSYSMASVIRKLGIKLTGGNYKYIAYRIRYLEISIDHFDTQRGQSWSKGKTKETDERIFKCAKKRTLGDDEIFIENARPIGGGRIAKRLLELDWKYECNACGLTKWLDNPITLHLDHINGIGNDNRFENLRFLCPNCHQQTETWGNGPGKKAKKEAKPNVCVDCGEEITKRAKRCCVCAGNRKTVNENVKEEVRPNVCVDCGEEITKRAKRCYVCANRNSAKIRPNRAKIDWPSVEQLIKMVEKEPYTTVAKRLGVSDNAIRKHIKKT